MLCDALFGHPFFQPWPIFNLNRRSPTSHPRVNMNHILKVRHLDMSIVLGFDTYGILYH